MSSNRREKSLRKAARERYLQMAGEDVPTPDPSPQGGGELMQRLRALYEDGVVPVREIARIAGVAERTLYKYIEKGAWRRRYRCSASNTLTPAHQNLRSGARQRGLGGEGKKHWQTSAGLAPVKGAGGRFIRREEAGLPHASGIKALDPQGAARAVSLCAEAARVSEAAAVAAKAAAQQRAAQALARKHEKARGRAFDILVATLEELAKLKPSPRHAAAVERLQEAVLRQLAALSQPS
jgi:hypothetical protein